MNYYNENDKFAAEWLRQLIKAGLIPSGEVDERSISDVEPKDLEGFTQCHFFAGIAGWPRALELASWPSDRPVWTGSCPCQKFSTASRGRRVAQDLWPEFFRLIASKKPGTIFSEQVAVAKNWFDSICDEMEAIDYEIGAAIIPAVSVGKNHKRDRIYFVAHSDRKSQFILQKHEKMAGMQRCGNNSDKLLPPDGIPNKMAIMRCFGNAIVPQVAAEFIKAYLDS